MADETIIVNVGLVDSEGIELRYAGYGRQVAILGRNPDGRFSSRHAFYWVAPVPWPDIAGVVLFVGDYMRIFPVANKSGLGPGENYSLDVGAVSFDPHHDGGKV